MSQEPQFYVAPDALERLSDPPKQREFIVDWEIMGQLKIMATDETEAYRKSMRFSKEFLADTGELTMYWPHEKDEAGE